MTSWNKHSATARTVNGSFASSTSSFLQPAQKPTPWVTCFISSVHLSLQGLLFWGFGRWKGLDGVRGVLDDIGGPTYSYEFSFGSRKQVRSRSQYVLFIHSWIWWTLIWSFLLNQLPTNNHFSPAWSSRNRTGALSTRTSSKVCIFLLPWTTYINSISEGVLVAKKDYNAPKHEELDVPNLQVIKAMQSLTSKGLVKTQFSWQWYYYVLTPEGVEYLREW